MIRNSFLLSALLLLAPRFASATVMVPPTDDEMVTSASVIAMATVERLEVTRAANGQVMTHAELKIERGVRGAGDGSFIAMVYPGGRLASGIVSSVPGAPELKVGDRVFAYLRNAPSGSLVPIGLRYGMLEVHRGTDGQYRANRRLDGLSFIDKSGTPAATERYHLSNVRIDRLVEDIQARMRRLNIDGGPAARDTSRGLSIPVVRP